MKGEVVRAIKSRRSFWTEVMETAWGNATDLEFTKVFRLQKYAIRILAHLKYDASCRGVFKRLNILTLPAIYMP